MKNPIQVSKISQGLAHDTNYWYFSNKTTIMKFNRQTQKLIEAGIPAELANQGYDHYGDCDFYEGHLYVPLEGLAHNLDPLIIVFDSNLQQVRYGPLRSQTHAPWCAVHPWDGRLYSCEDDNVSALNAYDLITLKHVDQFRIYDTGGNPEVLQSIQGGCFSNRGRLYLTSDSSEDIRCYSMLNGRFLGRREVSYSKGFSEYEEMEGITLWDLSGEGDGHIHVAILDNDWPSEDDLFLYHFKADVPELI